MGTRCPAQPGRILPKPDIVGGLVKCQGPSEGLSVSTALGPRSPEGEPEMHGSGGVEGPATHQCVSPGDQGGELGGEVALGEIPAGDASQSAGPSGTTRASSGSTFRGWYLR